MPLFKVAAEQWLATKRNLSRFTELHYRQYVARLSAEFGIHGSTHCDIRLVDIAELQQKRQGEGLGNRAVRVEIQVLRQVLKESGLWGSLRGRVRFLHEPKDTGRAVSQADEERLLEAAGNCRSPAVLPRLVLALDTGVRTNEMRHLRYRDLKYLFGAMGPWSNLGSPCRGQRRKAEPAARSRSRAGLARSSRLAPCFSDTPADGSSFRATKSPLQAVSAYPSSMQSITPGRAQTLKRLDRRLPLLRPSLSLARSPAYSS